MHVTLGSKKWVQHKCRKHYLTHCQTYIHNWLLQPFSQDYWPSFSHHFMLCVLIFIHKWRDLQFKVDSERQIFWETFHGNFISTLRFLLSGNRRRNTFRISFWCLTWDSNPGFSSNKPTHYLLDHGDFRSQIRYDNYMFDLR